MDKKPLDDPWDWMQPYDVQRFGDVILDRKEQERWCRAVLLGGLPFMWRKAEAARNIIYDRLELRPGDKVLIIGECIAPCGFVEDMKQRIGPSGEVHVVDITDDARDNYIAKKRGRGGQLATWQWTYTKDFADGAFDCAVCLQGVQHTDDWRETGAEMLRVMKAGRSIVLAEIAYSPATQTKIRLDMHIQYVFDKLLARVGWTLDEFPYYSPQDLEKAFADLVNETGSFVWNGIEIFWGRKPR